MLDRKGAVVLAVLAGLAFMRDGRCETLVSEKQSQAPALAKEQRLERIEARIQELDQRLDLSLEQKIKIKEILTKEKSENAKIVSEAATKSRKLKEKSESEIESLLTKKQLDLFRNVVSEEDQAEEEDEMLKVFRSNKR